MTARRLSAVPATALAALVGFGCGASDPHESPRRGLAFDSVFEAVAVVGLEEPFADAISDIRRAAFAPDGRIVVPDAMQHKVRVYTPEGRLIASLGRRGRAPGEFEHPLDAVFRPDGSLAVIEVNRVTLYDAQLRFDTVFPVDDAVGMMALERLGDDLLVRLYSRVPGAAKLRRYRADGTLLQALHPEHPLIDEVPYWRTANAEVAAASASRLYVANALLYPILVYSQQGELLDSMGTPPASWRQARRPKAGEFRPGDVRSWTEYVKSYTSIERLQVLDDSLLLVVHSRLKPEVEQYWEYSHAMDVYGRDAVKLYEDLTLPGPVLSRDGSDLYVLIGTAPEGWRIGKYRLRGEG